MLQQFFKLLRVGFLPLLLVLGGCGGSEDTPLGSLTDPDIYLSSLVVSGYDIGFESTKTGPYEIQVPNSVSTLSLSPTANRDSLIIESYQTSTLGATNSTSFTTISSGGSQQYTLAEGTNFIYVFVRNDQLIKTTYTLKVNRVSTTASLVGAAVANLLVANQYFSFNETFDLALFDYTVDVPYENCSTSFKAATNNASTKLTLTTPLATIENAVSSFPQYFDLQTGANQVTAELISEDGLNTATYNFTITRAAGTAAEIAANANLASLDLNPGELPFYCGNSTYSAIYVNKDVATVELVAQPEDPAASILVNDASYVAGETFEITLDADGGTLVEVDVTSADGNNTRTYTLVILNNDRNVVKVNTAEELQTALLTAEPNDEIRVASGIYTGVASIGTSGSDTAHFASSQSGTLEEPIYLVAASIYEDSILSGTDTTQNAVLELTGDHWVIVGLKFENAKNGIVFDSASENVIRTIEIRNTGAQNLVMRNGSTNNSITNARFGLTGVGAVASETGIAEAVLIGSDDALWQSNPDAAGPFVESDNNNVIRSSFFASSIASEAIEVNEGVTGTTIEFNTFESGSLTAQAGDTSLIRIQGNDTVVRYNTFYHESDVNLAEVIAIDDASESWHTIDWGEDSQIYQNEFLLSGAAIPVVNANSTATFVAENFREADGVLTFSGTGIDQNSFSVPFFQIQMAADQSLCVATGEYTTATSLNSVTIARAETCVDNDLAMQWKLVTAGDGYIRIQSAANTELHLYPINAFVLNDPSDITKNMIRIREVGVDGLIYDWRLFYQGQDILFINKSNENFFMSGLVDENNALQVGSPVVMYQATTSAFQRFRLVEQ